MTMRRYPHYKDSGVDWIGPVPSHWSITRYKEIFGERQERSVGGEETLLSVSAYTGVSPRSELIEEGDHLSRAESLEGYKVCYPNDLVMNIMLAWNRGLGFSRHHGIVSPAYSVFRLKPPNDPKFMDYLVRSDQVIGYFKAFSSGVIESRLRLYPDTFGALSCALPPPVEQSAIARFLDHETAKIDALIAEQERLLTLLAEKRQAVISHAVTKGLSPRVPFKDSGVSWLGDVPAHWRVGKLGFYVSVVPGFAFPSSRFSYEAADVRLLRGVNVGVGRLRWDDVVYWKREKDDGLGPYELSVGDVVIGMDRPLISNGMRVATVRSDDVPCLLLQRVAKIVPGREILGAFIQRLLASGYFEAHFVPETTGVSVPHISGDQIASFVVPVPPVEEQRKICEFIDREMDKVDGLVDQSLEMIDLLHERRSALIASVVAGQSDVREAC